MPAFMTEALAPSLYRRAGPSIDGSIPEVYSYGRTFWQDNLNTLFTNRASGITNLGVATNAAILVVGSAFGYLMEALNQVGVDEIWGIEPGEYFWNPARDTDWAVGMKARTVQDWIGSGTEVASFNALGIPGQARFTFIIDEDAAPSHSDAELPAFIAGLEARLQGNVKGRIIHIVTPLPDSGPGDSSQNWKTMVEWKAVAPDHTWVNAHTGQAQP